MHEFLKNFFASGPFIPHGHCYLWKADLIWLHLVSDSGIALAYYSIPITLVYFVRKRQDLPFNWIFLLFGTFIIACGTTHLMEVWTLWHPAYWLSGTIKLLTATVSMYTAVLLVGIVPQALALPSPAELEVANQELEKQITERKKAEEALRVLNAELEQRVNERAAALKHSHEELVGEIAERQQADESLRQSLQRYRFLADAMPQIVWTARPDGHLDYYNQRWYDYTGMTLEQTEGWGWGRVLHPDDLQLCIDRWAQAYQTGEHYEVEYRFKRASDGTYRWHLGRALPMKNEEGAIVQWFGTCTDINDQKQVEEEIRSALETEKQLGELKSRFVSMTSHEFRTPLATILSSAELLEHYSHRFSEDKKLLHLQRIQTAVKSMAHLLEDVLLIGKAEAGKLEFNPTPLDLEQFCRDLVEEMQIGTTYSTDGNSYFTLAIAFGSQGECTDACMDEKLLRHALSNLFSNAIKYSPQGGTVHFELLCKQGEAVFQVRDQGIGIPAEDQAHLFDSFHRASNVGTISGTGLGLAIAKKSVELHGGKITVESEVGVGTTFRATIPLNI